MTGALEIAIHDDAGLPGEGAIAPDDPALAAVTLRVVRPGDPVRVANVLDVVVPAVKSDDPDATFPGVLGPAGAVAGSGRTAIVEGVCVLPVCDWRTAGYAEAQEFPDAFVDMDGPGAPISPWSATTNVVMIATPASDASAADADRAVRRLALRVARDIAAASLDRPPTRVERYGPGAAAATRVAIVLQIGSEGPLLDTYLRGEPALERAPLVVDPYEFLDGVLTAGAYDWAGMRNPTAVYQRNALIRELSARPDVSLAGVVLSLGYLETAEEKREGAERSAELVRELSADAAICTTFESGNSHTDTMLTVRALERAGIRTVALVAETNGGLTDHVPEANCIVSVGNEDELVPAWTPVEIIGDPTAAAGDPIPAGLYLGALCQTGDHRLRGVPA